MVRDDVLTAWGLVTSLLRNTIDTDDVDTARAALAVDFEALIGDIADHRHSDIVSALLMITAEVVKAWAGTAEGFYGDMIRTVAGAAIGLFVTSDTPAHAILVETFMGQIDEAIAAPRAAMTVPGLIEQMSVAFAQLPEAF